MMRIIFGLLQFTPDYFDGSLLLYWISIKSSFERFTGLYLFDVLIAMVSYFSGVMPYSDSLGIWSFSVVFFKVINQCTGIVFISLVFFLAGENFPGCCIFFQEEFFLTLTPKQSLALWTPCKYWVFSRNPKSVVRNAVNYYVDR